jgi:hypothetical protein
MSDKWSNDEQHKHNLLTNPSYREWWEANKERILEEDSLRREMTMKYKVAKRPDEFMDQMGEEAE